MVAATHTKFSKPTGGKLEYMPVTASVAFKKGDPIILSSGKIQQALALPGSNNSATASGGNAPIGGFAEEDFTADASGVSTDGQSRTRMLVRLIDDTLRWETRGYNGTATDCQQQDFAIGTAYLMQRWRGASADEWWYEVNTTTTNGEWMKENQSPNSGLTSNYGISNFKPILSATVRQMQ